MNEDCKLNLPDYFVNDDFILTFTQIVSRTSWFGIPWQLKRRQIIWSDALLLALTVCIIYAIKRMLTDNSFDQIFIHFMDVVKFFHGFLAILLIRRVRTKWALIAKAWTTGNHALPEMGAGNSTLRKNMLKIFTLFAVLYALERVYLIVNLKLKTPSSFWGFLNQYIAWSQIATASSSSHAPYLAAPMTLLMLLSVTVISIEDFVVIAFGMGLADRQRRLNKVMKCMCEWDSVYRKRIFNINVDSAEGPKRVSNDIGVWRKLREAFVRHSRLVTIVNDAIGPLIFTSVFAKLSYILVILVFRFSTVKETDPVSLCYYIFSIASILLRSFIILLKTSDVHDLSTFGGEYLKMCSMKNYNVELRRFYFQLSKNEVALSGMGFFTLRRVFMLNALSVIITYHLMLLQYNDRFSRK